MKIEKNIKKDKTNKAKLRKDGWKVLRIWEHEIKNNPSHALNRIKKILRDK